MNDPHRILDLPYDASPEEIRERYRQLVRIFHPDRYRQDGDKVYAEAKLKEINEAYEALLNRTRPDSLARLQQPQPIFSPESVDFGTVAHGHSVQRRVQVGNSGATATALQFYFGDGQSWFTLVRGQRLNTAQPLPLNLDIEANTATLAPNQRYESWLEVDMDGVRSRLPLTIEVTDIETATPASMPWLPMAAVALVVLGLLLGARYMRAPRAAVPDAVSQALAPAVPTATATATSPVVEPSTGAAFSQEPEIEVVSAAPAAIAPVIAGGGTNTSSAALSPVSAAATLTSTLPPTQAVPATVAPTPEATATAALQLEETASPAPVLQTSTVQTSTVQTSTVQPDVAEATALPDTPAAVAATATSTPEPTQAAVAAVTVRVPAAYQVNARTDTSVESISLGLLDKGAVFPAVARTIDNAWVRIVLPDGNEAWVFTASMEADIVAVATLPVIYTEVPTAVPAVESVSVVETTPPPQPDPVDAQTTRTHVVQPGEFLKQLAVEYYGDEELWTLIYSANADAIGPEPDLLTAGLELFIPAGP